MQSVDKPTDEPILVSMDHMVECSDETLDQSWLEKKKEKKRVKKEMTQGVLPIKKYPPPTPEKQKFLISLILVLITILEHGALPILLVPGSGGFQQI